MASRGSGVTEWPFSGSLELKNTFISLLVGMDGNVREETGALRRCASAPVLPGIIEGGPGEEGACCMSALSTDVGWSSEGGYNEIEESEDTWGPQWSVGAQRHGNVKGSCKPCAWHWKPGGCVKGTSCPFCHMCEDGEVKKNKKLRRKSVREIRRRALLGRHQHRY